MNNKKIISFALSISILFGNSNALNKQTFLLIDPYKYEKETKEDKDLKKSRKKYS